MSQEREQQILEELQKMWQFVTKSQETNEKHFHSLGVRLDGIDGQIDFLVMKVLEHEDQFTLLRSEMQNGFRQVLGQMEGLAQKVDKHEQELIVMPEWIKRVEKKIDKHLLTPHPQA